VPMTTKRLERRNFLKRAAQGAATAAVFAPLTGAQNKKPQQTPTSAVHQGAATAIAPKPSLTLNVRDFGATGDGQAKDTAAIQQALDHCGVLGGGDVVVPAGNYSTGSLALRGNTILRLEEGANLLGTDKFEDYLVTQVRWEGRWMQGHTGLIYAIDADHIGIVGPGKITGNPALGGRPNAQNPLRHPCLVE
jgi:polygalacturonase